VTDPAILRVTIPGPPVGKGRPRLSTAGGFARAYTPAKTASWERAAAVLARDAYRGAPLDVPLVLVVRAVAARPKRLLRKCDPDGRIWRTTKPDADNVAKAAGDALTMAGVLRDDAFVVRFEAESLYAARTEGPCVELELYRAPAFPAGGDADGAR